MRVSSAVNISDLRSLAKRRLPRVIFDLLDGASEDERALALNLARLRQYSLVPRVLRAAVQREQSTTLFGQTYSTFFGISPTGFISLLRRDIELMLANAAHKANIPMILSGVSAEPIETVAALAPGQVWSQLYAAKDPKINADLVRRAQDCGVDVLVWTVDMAAAPKNDRLIRNGLGVPPRISLMSKLEALMHPAWIREYLRGGMTKLGSWEPYVPPGAPPFEAQKLFMAQRFESLTWRGLETLRRLWNGQLIVKGILHPDDALRVAELGGDGVIVSNHGGMGLDRAPAAIDRLAGVVSAVGQKLTVMFDGGVRRGSDIVVARCLGAKFVFVGRATLYGVVAGGLMGALHAINVLKDEVDRTMAQIGCSNGEEFRPEFVQG
jgi:(S)-mandelate dehydrogenase